MSVTAVMRSRGGEGNGIVELGEKDLSFAKDGEDPWIISVPGFGFLVVGHDPTSGDLMARVFQPPSETGRSRELRVVGDQIEIAMLHKFDRLDVVIRGML